MIKEVTKLWGKEEWLVNNEVYCAKYLNLIRGYQCSLHFHKIKDETFYVVEGVVKLEVLKSMQPCDIYNKNTVMMNKGEQFRLRPGTIHRFSAYTPKAKILEISTTHFDSDSYRIKKACKIKV